MSRLRTLSLLQPLDDKTVAALETRCRFRRYDEAELIVDFDDESHDVYFLMSGRVRVLYRTPMGREVILAELGQHDMFGELAAIDGERRSANVTALQMTEVAIMPERVFFELILSNEGVARTVLRQMGGRIRALNIRLAEHSFLSARHRLYAELLRLSRPRPNHARERSISPPPYQHDIAARIGCRREQVSRELKVLRDEGLVDQTKGAIVIRDPQELNRRISEAFDN